MSPLHIPSTPGQGIHNSLPSGGDATALVHRTHLHTWLSCSRRGQTRDGGVGDMTRLFAKLDVSRPTAPVGGDDIQALIGQMLGLNLSRAPKPEAIETIYIDIRRATERRAGKRRAWVISSKSVQSMRTDDETERTRPKLTQFSENTCRLRAAHATKAIVIIRKGTASMQP